MTVRLCFLIFCFGLPVPIYAGDPSPSPVRQTPLGKPLPLIPLAQKDGHSCGFLALSAVYKSYGLDPITSNLRVRLGTDIPLVPFLPDTMGTVQPDFFRVLKQDGFLTIPVNPYDQEAEQRIINHLGCGQYVLTLIKRRENGNLHWVVLTAYDKGSVTVGDSLRTHLYKEPLGDFLAHHIQSVLLLTPADPAPHASYTSEHGKGIFNMVQPWRKEFIWGLAILFAACLVWAYHKKGALLAAKKETRNSSRKAF